MSSVSNIKLSGKEKILIIQHKMIGDVLTTSILFEAIKQEYPMAEIHYLINTNTLAVVKNNPLIDKVIEFTKAMEQSKPKFFSFLKNIKAEKYDVVIDVYGKTGSAFTAFYLKAKIRIGKSKPYLNWAYTHKAGMNVIRNHGIPLAYENRLNMLQPIVKQIDYSVTPKIFISAEEKKSFQIQLKDEGISLEDSSPVMFNILGSSKDKTYPLPYLAKLLDELVTKFPEISFLFNYIPNQQEQVDELKSFCSSATKNKIIDFYAPSLREFIVLTSFCKALIGNEGGAIHMAKAVEVPSFAIFSPWIRKETWGTNTNDNKNVNVHLKDFKPELFENYDKNEFKKNQENYYLQFQPELIEEELNTFIENILN